MGLKYDEYRDHEFFKGVGCKECNNSGFRDRTGLFEVIEVNQHLKELISQRQSAVQLLRYLQEQRIPTIHEACLEKVLDGEVPIEEYIMVKMG